jgi:hypothetical protein
MLAVFRRIKRHIKQAPGLWRAFSRARALAGVLNSRRAYHILDRHRPRMRTIQ